MRFGLHLSPGSAVDEARALGCGAVQIFCGNPRGWSKPPQDLKAAASFRAAAQDAGLDPVVVHATYLINLAAPEERIWDLSVDTFLDELRRSQALGAWYYVVHSGSHKGQGEDLGRKRIAAALRRADAAVKPRPEILLENTAGTANSLGTSWEDLRALLDGAGCARVGVCLDTCHALAAGYEIRTRDGAARTLDAFDHALGLRFLRCLHCNDSKGGLGSRLDRHEHIGAGEIGAAGFRAFFSDRRVWDLPAILETPQDEPDDKRRDLRTAVQLAVAVGAAGKDALARVPAKPLAATGAKQPVRAGKKPAAKRRAAKRR